MRKRAGILAIVGVALLVWGSGAIADDSLTGVAAVRGKNTRTRTVQLGERTFRLNDHSVIRDADGARIRLADLDVPDLGRGGSDLMLGAFIGRYDAVRHGQRLILITLDIQPSAE